MSAWLSVRKRVPGAAVRLFCFHFAGAGASMFRAWPSFVGDGIEIIAVQLPGREGRFCEPLIHEAHRVISQLLPHALPLTDKPYFVFGHSIGALLAYEFVCRLRDLGCRMPRHLIVSGRAAPHLPRSHDPVHRLPDSEFLKRLHSFEGTSAEVLADARLMALLLPMIRADFAIGENYVHTSRRALPCPITAIGGRDDRYVSEPGLLEWRNCTTGLFQSRTFSGGHFFIHPPRADVLEYLNGILACAPSRATAEPADSPVENSGSSVRNAK